jgi:hypothetical protein
MKKGSKFRPCEHYGVGYQKNNYNFVMTNFKYFWVKKTAGKKRASKIIICIQNPINFSHAFF